MTESTILMKIARAFFVSLYYIENILARENDEKDTQFSLDFLSPFPIDFRRKILKTGRRCGKIQ